MGVGRRQGTPLGGVPVATPVFLLPGEVPSLPRECGVAACLCGAIAWPGARSVRECASATSSQPATRRYSNSGVRPAAHSCPAVANCLPSAGFWESAAPYGTYTNLPYHCPIAHPGLASSRGRPPPVARRALTTFSQVLAHGIHGPQNGPPQSSPGRRHSGAVRNPKRRECTPGMALSFSPEGLHWGPGEALLGPVSCRSPKI